MTNTGANVQTLANPEAEITADATRGWYLYGITRRAPLATVLDEAHDASDGAPLQLLECSGLTAVVRPVLLEDFSLAALQARLRSVSELEAMVRSHNRVIDAIHAQQAILPAKFGSVYAHAEDVVSALEPVQDALLRQLARLEGCDEWAFHLYAQRAVVRERVTADDAALQRLRDELAAARPGRAYFLERQLRDQAEAATRQELVALAQKIFEQLAGHAVAAQMNDVAPGADGDAEVEILRAAFLVTREGAEPFEAQVRACADANDGLRCACSGPWPPYSFAAFDEKAEA